MVHSAWSSEFTEDQSRGGLVEGHDTSTVNGTITSIHGKKNSYHEPTAPPSLPAYASDSRYGDIDVSSSVSSMNKINRARDMDKAQNGQKSKYPSRPAAPALAGYPSSFQSDDVDSSLRPNNTSSTSDANRVVNTDTAKNSKNSGTKNSTTASPALAGHPRAFQTSNVDFSSPGDYTNPTNSSKTMNTAKNGKKGNYGSSTASAPAVAGYPGSRQSGGDGRSSNSVAAAWEEHVDEITNRRYFYNSITRRSTWGKPDAMVKKPPPPPPSLPPHSAIVEKREQDHWFKMGDERGRRVWYNDITNRSQVERPDCLRKYK